VYLGTCFGRKVVEVACRNSWNSLRITCFTVFILRPGSLGRSLVNSWVFTWIGEFKWNLRNLGVTNLRHVDN